MTTPITLATPSLFSAEETKIINLFSDSLRTYSTIRHPVQRRLYKAKILQTFREALNISSRDIDTLSILINSPQEEEVRTSYSIADLLSLKGTLPDWLVPNFIRAGGGLYVASGIPKAGKSLIFGYHLAYAVASGTPFLGLPVTAGKVLFFQCEESTTGATARFTRFGLDEWGPHTKEILDNSRIQVEFAFDLGADFQKLRELVVAFKPSLVIFDSFRAITSSLDISENSADISKGLYALQKLLNILGVSGLVIHHNKKDSRDKGAEGMSGSLAIAGANDGIFLLFPNTAATAQQHLVDIITVPRDGIPLNITVEKKNDSNGYWYYETVEEKAVEWGLIKARKRILKFLSEHPDTHYGKMAIAEGSGESITSSDFNFALEQLVESNQIGRVKAGKNNFEYWLPALSPWAKLATTSISVEFQDMDRLIHCKSREDIELLKVTWAESHGPEYINQIWSLLTDEEKASVLAIMSPRKFNVGDWVRDAATEVIDKIVSCEYDSELSSWVYQVEGKNDPFLESDLTADSNYSMEALNFEATI